MSNTPPALVRLIHGTLTSHYRKHHRTDDAQRAELFAESIADRLLGPATSAAAGVRSLTLARPRGHWADRQPIR